MTSDREAYVKHLSFGSMHSRVGASVTAETARAVAALSTAAAGDFGRLSGGAEVAREVHARLTTGPGAGDAGQPYRLSAYAADEMSRLTDAELPRYLIHRYRYDTYPAERRLDDYPPCVQIEPASMCNYRCVFCYQTDATFSRAREGFMGHMSLALFRRLVDELDGHVEFVTLASRGEPLLCPEIEAMLSYCGSRFMGLKLNTNASRLSESLAHAVLSSGVRTLVISADAASAEEYARYRVRGSLERVAGNVRRFTQIREQHYPRSRLVTRVSGVMYDGAEEHIDEMVDFWGRWVDQVCFVRYNPWENVYETAPSGVECSCTDLWRRTFVWHDGVVNPCDVDYKSRLSVGRFPGMSLAGLWHGDGYERLRERHLEGHRGDCEPCARCVVT